MIVRAQRAVKVPHRTGVELAGNSVLVEEDAGRHDLRILGQLIHKVEFHKRIKVNNRADRRPVWVCCRQQAVEPVERSLQVVPADLHIRGEGPNGFGRDVALRVLKGERGLRHSRDEVVVLGVTVVVVQFAENSLRIGQLDSAGFDLHLFGDQVVAHVLTVDDEVDPPTFGSVRRTDSEGIVERQLVTHQGTVGIVGEKHPRLGLRHSENRRPRIELDLIGLLGQAPCVVAAALELCRRGREVVRPCPVLNPHQGGNDAVLVTMDVGQRVVRRVQIVQGDAHRGKVRRDRCSLGGSGPRPDGKDQ